MRIAFASRFVVGLLGLGRSFGTLTESVLERLIEPATQFGVLGLQVLDFGEEFAQQPVQRRDVVG